MLGQRVINNMLGNKPKADKHSFNKRKCKVCGQVHKNMPFTDCYSEQEDGPLPDDIQSYYKDKFGDY